MGTVILEGILLGLGTPTMYINHVLMGHQGIEVNIVRIESELVDKTELIEAPIKTGM